MTSLIPVTCPAHPLGMCTWLWERRLWKGRGLGSNPRTAASSYYELGPRGTLLLCTSVCTRELGNGDPQPAGVKGSVSQDQVWLLSFFVTLGKSLLLWTGVKPLEEKASPAREAKCHFGPISRGSDIPSLTSYNAASVSNHCFELANCWQSIGFPGNILETCGNDSGYRCGWTVFLALCTVQGNVLYAGHLHITKQGPLSHTVSRCPIRRSWRTGDTQNILQLVWWYKYINQYMHHILKIFFNSQNDQNYLYIHTSCC